MPGISTIAVALSEQPTAAPLKRRTLRVLVTIVLMLLMASCAPGVEPRVAPGTSAATLNTASATVSATTTSGEATTTHPSTAIISGPSATPTGSPAPLSPTATADPTPNPFAILTAIARTPTRPPAPAEPPTTLIIPRIGLTAPVFPVGQDANGNAVVLKHDVGWYDRSGRPGQGTSIIFWAHVLRWRDSPTIPAPFEHLAKLQPGDHLALVAAGRKFNYTITAQVRVRPEQVDYLAPTPLERVILISCIGDVVISRGELTETERLVTIAEPSS